MLGLIAGGGRLPFLVAAGARKAGLRVACVALGETAEDSLADEVDVFHRADRQAGKLDAQAEEEQRYQGDHGRPSIQR